MVYRTKTYLAADWDGDKDAIDQLHYWNESNYFTRLDFVDVHDFVQARDTSLPCSIKESLHLRMNMSKTFILIVGDKTKNLTKGDCRLCRNYSGNLYYEICLSNKNITHKSYIEFECDQAVKYDLNIIVLYNSYKVDKTLCPDILINRGVHIPMKKGNFYWNDWDYASVRDALSRCDK